MKSISKNQTTNSKLIIAILSIVLLFIITDTKADEQVRSSSLKEVITQDGNIVRKDFVNEQGNITYAVDLRYATVIISYSDHSQIEEYLDADGNPARQRQGHYAIYKEYDEEGRNWRISYLGIDKKKILTSNGYASIIRTFYENGNIKTEHYYDEQGNPIKTNAYGYGCYKEYDKENRNRLLIYLGNDDKPVVTGQGFAIIRRVFYEEGFSKGKVKEEFYFNSDDEPTLLMYGQSGLHKEYDQYGRTILLTYLDESGNPIVTRAGYTTIRRTYYEDDSIESEMYFDKDGEPVSLSEGQYGVRYKDGKTIYLNKYGRKQINVKNILYNNEWVVILTVVFISIVSIFSGHRMNILFLVFYLAVIVYMTLMHRIMITEENYDIIMTARGKQFSNNILSKDTLNNCLLFLPLGTILYRIYPKMTILFIPVLLSIFIELVQYLTKTGLYELNDIISNGLGGFAGYLVGSGLTKICSITKRYYGS